MARSAGGGAGRSAIFNLSASKILTYLAWNVCVYLLSFPLYVILCLLPAQG